MCQLFWKLQSSFFLGWFYNNWLKKSATTTNRAYVLRSSLSKLYFLLLLKKVIKCATISYPHFIIYWQAQIDQSKYRWQWRAMDWGEGGGYRSRGGGQPIPSNIPQQPSVSECYDRRKLMSAATLLTWLLYPATWCLLFCEGSEDGKYWAFLICGSHQSATCSPVSLCQNVNPPDCLDSKAAFQIICAHYSNSLSILSYSFSRKRTVIAYWLRTYVLERTNNAGLENFFCFCLQCYFSVAIDSFTYLPLSSWPKYYGGQQTNTQKSTTKWR